ncbi:MAG: hypothetical protein HY599_06940 [Candidatus Omnitrophica bacterium]|nr:hypothetical protein [Candidatus Omnitrophota bacterium]
MTASATLTDIVQQFAHRYRRALTVKAALLGGLSLAIAGILGWRLHPLALSAAWRIGLPAAIGLAASGALVWWLRKRWLSSSTSVAYLDERLGLQQRLVTAAEFAGRPQPPALYPLLLEDAARRCSPEQLRAPRPLDRTAALLVVLLLAVWLWPLAGRSPLQQVVQLPKTIPPTPAPEPPAPPQSPSSDQRDQQQQPQQADGGSDAQQPSSGGQDQSPNQPPRGREPPRAPSSSQQPSSEGSSGEHQAQGTPQDSRDQSRDGGARSADQPHAESDARGRAKPSDRGGQQPSSSSGSGQQQGQGRQQAQADASGSQGKQDQGQPGAAAPSSGGAGQQLSAGDQEALKADIQQLLKEVSGELKDLQEQLAAAQQSQPPPQAGTATDPDLYGTPERLDPAKGDEVPIPLKSDAAPTKTRRPGGGTGEASPDVSTDGPRMGSEDAQLSDTPADEASAGRQPVPPEYRDVFDRLNRNTAH